MKLSKKFFTSFVASLLVATSAWAGGEINIIKQLNGTVNNDAGTVTSQVSEATGKCTLTVTPAAGNYITVELITAERIIDAGQAQGRLLAPSMENSITVTAESNTADPSGETTYTFEMPDADYDVEVTANFQTRTSIADAVVTLAETTFTYDHQAKEPAVSSVVLGTTTLTASTDYTFEYSDNVNAGTGTVTVTGQGIYTGTATATFTINKAALDFSVGINGWTYGAYNDEENIPFTDGLEYIDVVPVYTYKAKDATDNTYTETVPVNAGDYVIRATVAESDNYQAGEATAEFTITKAELGNASVTLTGWTYGDNASTPVVNGNSGNGTVTYEYSAQNATSENWVTDMPTNAGSYNIRATIAESDNYLGTSVRNNFTIQQADFSQVEIADIANQTFTGEAITPAVTVTFKGNAVNASEYEVNYANNTNVGEATVTLTSKNVNFYGGQVDPSKTFLIVAAAATITGTDQTVTYNGQAQAYTNGSVDNGTLVVTYYNSEAERDKGSNALEEEPTNAGIYYVQLTQSNANYSAEPVNVTFTINPKSLEDVELWSEIDEDGIAYSGEPIVFEEGMFGLTDLINDESIYLVEDEDFTVAYANNTNIGEATVTLTGTGNYTGEVSFTFDIVRNLNITFDENREWATYYAAENLQLPVGLKAYIVTGIGQQEVTVEAINYIPQNVGVLLNYEGNIEELPGDFEFLAKAYTGATQTFETNQLQGTSAATDVTSITGGAVYVLYNNEFVKSTAGTIPANRAYLVLDNSVMAGPQSRSLSIVIAGEETGIAEVTGAAAANGQYYNLQGIRMTQPQKGLVIVNGKKMFVK